MSHAIEVFLFSESIYRHTSKQLPQAHFVWLPQDLVMVPVSDALLKSLQDLTSASAPRPFQEFYQLTPALVSMLRELSQLSPVAYLETEFFGGVGSQAAILFKNGAPELGPLTTRIEQREDHFLPDVPGEFAINRVLQRMGILRGDALDEFEAIGLRKHRTTAGWLNQTSP